MFLRLSSQKLVGYWIYKVTRVECGEVWFGTLETVSP